MTSVVITGRSMKMREKFIVSPPVGARRRRVCLARAGMAATARISVAQYSDLTIRYHAQLAIGDDLVAAMDIADHRDIGAVIKGHLDRA